MTEDAARVGGQNQVGGDGESLADLTKQAQSKESKVVPQLHATRVSTQPEPAGTPPLNSIGHSKERLRQFEPAVVHSDRASNRSSAGHTSVATSEGLESAIPDHIRERYIQVRRRFHFPDGDLAFHIREMRTTTRSESPQVIRDILEIERARAEVGQPLRIRGTAAFRAEAWMQSQLMGLDVSGYRPSDFERAKLARIVAQKNGVTPDAAPEKTVEVRRDGEPGTDSAHQSKPTETERDQVTSDEMRIYQGRLVGHGAANYQHDRHESMSYYIRLNTRDGEEVLWGRDFGRAIKESLSGVKIGDEVSVEHVGDRSISTKPRPPLDGVGRWIVESREFLRERQAAARVVRDTAIRPEEAVERHPTLVGTYVELHAAKLVAQESFRHEEDRERFIARVRNALADEIARGEAFSVLRIKGADARVQTNDPPHRRRVRVHDHART